MARARPNSLDGVDIVVMAGGPSTRYGRVQKLLTAIYDAPLVAWHVLMVDELVPYRLVVSLGFEADAVREAVEPAASRKRDIVWHVDEEARGTAVSLRDMYKRGVLKGDPVVVTYADTILQTPQLILDLVIFYRTVGLELAMLIDPYRVYGYRYEQKGGKLVPIEAQVPAGVYVFGRTALEKISRYIDEQEGGEDTVIDVEDAVARVYKGWIPAYIAPVDSVQSLETPADIPRVKRLLRFSSFAGPLVSQQ
ncbi:NTP transferase domain-containing protein [Thermogladius sp.]|uniref:NTP transferase domain-containing protein n=1 Tax=Thermogladius sp. TaxID=2023064 RepID=UPI003D1051AE